LALGLVLSLRPATGAAEGPAQKAVDRAHNFLNTAQRGKDILGFLHFGASYRGHSYTRTLSVKDGAGRAIPDHFAIVYLYKWEADGETEVGFLCDGRGTVYKVQVLRSNGVFSRPFALANATMQVLGNVLIDALGDKMTAADKRDLQKIVDEADAKAMLEWSLKFQQAIGR
jgi:hypothetical protein